MKVTPLLIAKLLNYKKVLILLYLGPGVLSAEGSQGGVFGNYHFCRYTCASMMADTSKMSCNFHLHM